MDAFEIYLIGQLVFVVFAFCCLCTGIIIYG